MKHATLVLLALTACTVKMPSLHTGGSAKVGDTSVASAKPSDDDSGSALDPKYPAPDPDPTPPAFKDSDGDVNGWGGPISETPSDCTAAQNHCLRANGWFVSGAEDNGIGPEPRTPVFKFEGHWYTYRGRLAGGGTLYRTKPATAENIQQAREVFVFLAPPTGAASLPTGTVLSAIPKTQREALLGKRWTRISVYTVDAKAGTFVADDAFTYEIAAARVAFDPKEAE